MINTHKGLADKALLLLKKKKEAKILIDEISLEFLKGSEIDYVNELIGAAFKIHNPNAVASCGCGTSFSI